MLLLLRGRPSERVGRGRHPTREGLRDLRQAGRLVDRVADHRVLEPLHRADVAGHHRAGDHADPGADLGEVDAQACRQPTSGMERRAGRVVERHRRPEHREGAVALELVHPAMVLVDHLDGRGEEAVEQRHHLGRWTGRRQLGRCHHVDEQHRGVPCLAPQPARCLERLRGDVGTDVTTEQVARGAAPAPEARSTTAVEPALQLTELGGVVERDRRVEVALLDPTDRRAQVADRVEHGLHRDADQQPPDDERGAADDEDGDGELRLGVASAEQG